MTRLASQIIEALQTFVAPVHDDSQFEDVLQTVTGEHLAQHIARHLENVGAHVNVPLDVVHGTLTREEGHG